MEATVRRALFKDQDVIAHVELVKTSLVESGLKDLPEEVNMCPIHLGPLVSPVQDSCPGNPHLFCRPCLVIWLDQTHKCPVSRKFLSKATLKPVDLTKIFPDGDPDTSCRFQTGGCAWTGKISGLKSHLTDECPCMPITCKCKSTYNWSTYQEHHKEGCSQFQEKCPDCCAEFKNVKELQEHKGVCTGAGLSSIFGEPESE